MPTCSKLLKNTKSPGCNSFCFNPLIGACLYWSYVTLGTLTPSSLYACCTRPEQSTPILRSFPPHL